MASKNANIEKNILSSIIVKAVTKILDKKEKSYSFDVNDIQIIKVNNGSIQDTSTIDGVVVDKEVISDDLPTKVNKAKILLLNDSIEMKKTEIESKIEIRDPGQLQTFLDEEDRMIKEMVEKIYESGANVVFCQKGIDDLAINYLVEHKIFASRRVNKSDMEKVSKATGARIISSLDNISKDYLGYSDNVEIRKIGDTKMIYVTGCKNPKAVSIIIRGSTKHITDELERALHDSLSVVRVAIEDGYIITGGGSSFISTSMYLKKFAPTIGGREQMAIEAFAKALEIIPKVLAENAGLDPIDLLIDLKNKHSKGTMNQNVGIDINSGVTDDMMHLKVIEPLKVQTHAIESATETAIMILRIDDVIASKLRPPVSNSQSNPQNYM
jgi:chaperonin GroEL (HSP60 family)